MRNLRPKRLRPRGQAAVESAIVLPLVLFLILGILQLSMLWNARSLTQYAAFNAVRAGSVDHGSCNRMLHSAVATLMPAIEPFTARSPGTPGAALAEGFSARMISGGVRRPAWPPDRFVFVPGRDGLHDRDIVWIRRESPTPAQVAAVIASGSPENEEFDGTEPGDLNNLRLEAELIFWYPMEIPFANWIIARIATAHWGLIAFVERNPIVNNSQLTNFGDTATSPPFNAQIAGELVTRVNLQQYTLPLRASSTMRMMTPIKASNFPAQNCPPAP